ncbi:MAG: ester cyclase [Chloroflexota bacterium]
MINENNKQVLQTFMDQVWNSGDFSQIETLVAPNYEVRSDPGDPWEGQTLDIETLIERVLYSRNAFPDLCFDIQEMIEENEKVVASWIMSGTHRGDLPQLPATGQSFTISGMTIYYFDEHKICGHTQAFDRLGFLSQIGFFS